MANIIAVAPRVGEKGMYKFLKCVKRKFFFWSEPVFTYNINEAIHVDSYEDAEGLANYCCGKLGNAGHAIVLSDEDIEKLSSNKFYTIEKRESNGDSSYYCGEDLVKDKNGVKVMRQVPLFISDITKAEFFKGNFDATRTLMRVRLDKNVRAAIHTVYLSEVNDYTVKCILFALTNKQTKRTRYLKGYDLNGKPSDRLHFVDSMEKAWKVDIQTMVSVIDDIHAKHKIFIVNVHLFDGRDIPSSKYAVEKRGLSMTYKL